MKIIDKSIRYGLIVMIMLSLFLSWKILNNSDNKQLTKKQNAAPESVVALKKPTDVFLPVKLVYHNEKGQHLYSNKESLLQNLLVKIISNVENGSVGNKKTIDLHDKNESFELTMSDNLALNYFLAINQLEDNAENDNNIIFRRLVVSMDDSFLYFLDDKNKEVYHMAFQGDMEELQKILKDSKNRYLEVGDNQSNVPVYYQFLEPLHLPTYSYIVATQSYTFFSKAFFDKDKELISDNDDLNSRDINLSNAQGESLDVKYDTGEVKYSGHIPKKANEGFQSNTILEESFYYLQTIANSLGTLRYYESNDNQIVYRNYVEGYPVFSDGVRGRVEFSKKDQTMQIRTNQETVQVPIPSEEEVILPATQEVINLLASYGVEETAIKGLQIGYSWISNEETTQVIDLTPEWYVKLDDEWLSLDQVQTKVSQGANN